MRSFWFSLLFLFTGLVADLYSEEEFQEVGVPIYQRVTREGITLGASFTSLMIDNNGMPILVANGSVYTFNGSSWTQLNDQSKRDLISLSVTSMGPNGKLQAALIGDWGELTIGQNTFLEYNSSKPIGYDTGKFSLDVREMLYNAKGDLFLLSSVGLLRHSTNSDVHIWNHIGDAQEYFEVNGKEFVSTQNRGIYQILTNDLIEFPTPKIAGQYPTFMRSIPFNNGVLLASFARGLFYFDGNQLSPWRTSIDEDLIAGIRDMAQLPTGEIAVAIREIGLVFLNRNGEEITRLTGDSDKTFSKLMQIATDNNGVIWARTLSDTIKVHFPATITKIDQSLGFVPNWTRIRRIDGKIHLLTTPDIFVGQYNNKYLTHFEKFTLPDNSAQYFNSFDSLGGSMVIGTETGILILDSNNEVTKISDLSGAYLIGYNKGSPDTICAVGEGQVVMFEKLEQGWTQIGEPVTDKGLVNLMVSDSDGNFWTEGGNAHVFKVSRFKDTIRVETLDEDNGLSNGWINLFLIQGKIHATVMQEILSFDEASNKFIPSPKLMSQLILNESFIQRPAELSDGSLVVPNEQGLTKLIFSDGKYIPSNESFELLSSINLNLTIDDGDKIWISAPGDLYLYNPDRKTSASGLHKPRITTVSSISKQTRTIIFDADNNEDEPLEWTYKNNSLEINIFNRDYHLVAPAKHQYLLTGLSNNWSTPTSERTISFTNLDEGKYTLNIRAVDVRGKISEATEFSFTILPPYYRTPWAFLIYAFAVAFSILIIVKFFIRRQIREKVHLETIVEDKTAALQHALETAKKATEAKSMFLANMSHEIRTPMNAVIGLTQVLSETNLDETQHHHLRTIKSSGDSLLNIINDILDYSKLEAGQLTLEYIPTDIGELVGDVMDLLQDKAETENLTFNYLVDEEVSHTFACDPLRVKQILLNLVGNALKFTTEGEIFVHCSLAKRPLGPNKEFIRISIKDTGIGIAKDKLGKLFKVFSQVDASTTRMFGGTGLGLAICRFLVEKMSGRIWAESKPDEYTEFILEIPYTKCPQSRRFNPYTADTYKYHKLKICISGLKGRSKRLMSYYLNLWDIDCGDNIDTNNCQIVINEDILCESTRNVSSICIVGIQNKLDTDSLHNSITLIYKPIHPQFIHQAISKCIAGPENQEIKSKKRKIRQKFAEDYPLDILVVEDNMTNQRVIKLLLKNLGYSADVANNGQEALEKLEQHKFNVVLMDLQMPVMDGMTATRKIREINGNDQSPWIIAQSASALLETEGGIVAAGGMNDFISKPIIGKALKAALAKAHNQVVSEVSTW